jgi:mRNA interferase HicA
VKRVDLVKALVRMGCVFVRHGGRHDWYTNPATGVSQPVPRHREIGEVLAQRILRMLANPEDAEAGDDAAEDE